MRIRKNARVLVEQGTSFLICKLNRSPWDDDSFFSQLVEEGWDGGLTHSTIVSDSNPSGDSMELSFEYIDNNVAPSTPLLAVAKLEKCEGEIEKVNETNMTSSCNEVGDYFAKVVISHSQQPPLVPASPPQPKKRGRPKKPTQVAAVVGYRGGESEEKDNNDNDDGCSFYYYSGFGPSWKKNRSIIGNNSKNNSSISTKRSKRNVYSNNVVRTTSSSNQIMSEVDNDNANNMEEYGVNNNKKSENGMVETVYDEQLDYIEDEFDDDDNEDDDGVLYGGVPAKARPRKHIKARSLKSLM